MHDAEKRLIWIGSSKKDLLCLPAPIRRFFGHALYFAQRGEQHESTKVLKGFGNAGVLEIIEDDAQGTYRAVYTVRFSEAVFVLHCFQKKSLSGIATPKRELDIIRTRLKMAEQVAREMLNARKKIEPI
jgi:phage-related protein